MSAPTHTFVPAAKTGDKEPIFSKATIHNGVVYCSGVVGRAPGMAMDEFVPGSIKERTIQCIRNLEAVLIEAGSSLDKVLKFNIYVTNMADVPAMNEAYDSVITMKPRPARCCVAVAGLAKGTDIEIECTAYI